MAVIINDRDKLLQAAPVRITRVPIEISDVNGLPDALRAVRGLTITANAQNFFKTYGSGGVPDTTTSPATISLTANFSGISGTVTWSVVSGSLSIAPSGNICTLTGANMTSYTAVIRASIAYDQRIYTADITINKLGAPAGGDSLPAGAITAGTLAAGVVYAGQINADNINTGTLTGRTVQTAASGRRAVMDTGSSDSGKFEIFDSSNRSVFRSSPETSVTAVDVSAYTGGWGIVGRQKYNSANKGIAGVAGISEGSASAVLAQNTGTGPGFYANISGSGAGVDLNVPTGPHVLCNPRSTVPASKPLGALFFHSTKGLCQSDGTKWLSIQDGTTVT